MGTLMSTTLAYTTPITGRIWDGDMSLGGYFQRTIYNEAEFRQRASPTNLERTLQNSQEISDAVLSDDQDWQKTNTNNKSYDEPAPSHGGPTFRLKLRDINENPATENVTRGASAGFGKNDIPKQYSEGKSGTGSFQPELWPTLPMINSQISKHKEIPSTVIFARFYSSRTTPYVNICYSTSEDKNESFFESSAKLDTLMPFKENFPKMGDTKEEKIKHFLMIFKACINNLQGSIWWNGFSILLDQRDVKNRLPISALEVEPSASQVLFEITNMKNLVQYQTPRCLELRGKVEGSESAEENKQYIRFSGVRTKDIRVHQLRGNLITVHIPRFIEEYIEY